jgi:hypothetical protein
MNDILSKYPSFGSCEKGKYRLYGIYDEKELNRIQGEIFYACKQRAKNCPPCQTFQSYRYLNFGWEWSVFEGGNEVIKIPAGIFPETSDPRYLASVKHNRSVICKYVGEQFIAKTDFPESQSNLIRQSKLNPLPERILYKNIDKNHWKQFCKKLICLLDNEDWLPDLDIHKHSDGFDIRSVMEDENKIPKIMDFTAYFDVFRLYEEKTRTEKNDRRKVLCEIVEKLN